MNQLEREVVLSRRRDEQSQWEVDFTLSREFIATVDFTLSESEENEEEAPAEEEKVEKAPAAEGKVEEAHASSEDSWKDGWDSSEDDAPEDIRFPVRVLRNCEENRS